MRYEARETRVCNSQNISAMCLVCGTENSLGLHAQFLELEDGRLCAEFMTSEEHQSYPGRVHGGIVSAILDETIGRAIQITDPDMFGVTLELNVRFRKAVPLNEPLKVIAEITKRANRLFVGEGKLLLEDGSVAAEATARYYQMDASSIAEGGLTDENWFSDEREQPVIVRA
ncbi:MAG: PaaI family thioesterase [Coriobacteriales bacterium]|jgi:uncharacterized protein (TIGR00369 family)|nr:PaaI family thioesterase [Coriobacteriales bacterium]